MKKPETAVRMVSSLTHRLLGWSANHGLPLCSFGSGAQAKYGIWCRVFPNILRSHRVHFTYDRRV
ncbi:hypothetical protein QD712_37775 [Streptomyces acidiscabies]|uniref:hypothetical protein n=1 Tax=Streptomyces acidiscabies TaxID=42234 RepID=UPI0030CEE0EF